MPRLNRTRVGVGLTVLAVVAGAVLWLRFRRPAAAEDDAAPFPDGAVLLGSAAFHFPGSVGPWVPFDGGRRIALANGRRVRVIDAATRAELASWVAADRRFVAALAVTPDGRRVATLDAYSYHIRIWDRASGNLVKEYQPHRGYTTGSLGLTPDGRYVASVGHERPQGDAQTLDLRWDDWGVRVCDATTGEEHPAFRGGLPGGGGPAFSPDGQHLAWFPNAVVQRPGNGWRVLLRPLAGGPDREVKLPAERRPDGPLAFSPDGRLLALPLAGGGLLIWDLTSGAARRRFDPVGPEPTTHSLTFKSARFSPDGKTVLTARVFERAEDRVARLVLWDVEGGTARLLTADPGVRDGVEFAPDGKTVFTLRADRAVQTWDVATGAEHPRPGHRSEVTAVAVSPDAAVVATGGLDRTIRLWARDTGRELRVLVGHAGGVTGVAFGQDGRTLVSGSLDGTVRVWEVAGGSEVARWDAHGGGVRGLALSPDGAVLATGGSDGLIRLWDVPAGTLRRTLAGHAGWVTALAFSPDGAQVFSGSNTSGPRLEHQAVADDNTFRAWDAATGREVRQFPDTRVLPVPAVAVSPDGRLAVAGTTTRDTGMLVVREVATGAEHARLGRLDGFVSALAFSPDGRTLAVARWTITPSMGEVGLWDTGSWKRVGLLPGHTRKVNAVRFSSDTRFLVSGSDDGLGVVWDLGKIVPDR